MISAIGVYSPSKFSHKVVNNKPVFCASETKEPPKKRNNNLSTILLGLVTIGLGEYALEKYLIARNDKSLITSPDIGVEEFEKVSQEIAKDMADFGHQVADGAKDLAGKAVKAIK